MSHETTGTFVALLAERVTLLEKRVSLLEGCSVAIPEHKYMYKDAFGWHLTNDFNDIQNRIGVEEWKVVNGNN